MTKASSRTKEIFHDKIFFEKEVLNVKNNNDRRDVIAILIDTLVRDTLKEHLNFLYIENFSDFTLEQIVNIIFTEMANSWLNYAMDELSYSRDDALDELRIEHRVKFLKSLSRDYYNSLKNRIFEEIADTFIELLILNTKEDKKSVLINAVINSNLIPNRTTLNIKSWEHLEKCVKVAKDLKGENIAKLENFNHTLQKVKNSIIYSLQQKAD